MLTPDALPAALVRAYRRSAADKTNCWRVIPPKYAHTPLSTLGAQMHGGRWNRIGTPALYLSEPHAATTPIATAWAEYQQDIGIRIGILVPYDVDLRRVADLTDPVTVAALDLAPGDFQCAWKDHLTRREIPPTWPIVDALRREKIQAVRVPSAVLTGGVNLVVYEFGTNPGAYVGAVDPEGALPVDQASWPATKGPGPPSGP